jgi:hypothetical protein
MKYVLYFYISGARGGVTVKALRYKPAGRGFDSRWCQIFQWHNPAGHTMTLQSTQPLTEMSTRCISWGKGGRCIRLTSLPSSCAVVMKSGNINFLEPCGPLQAGKGTDCFAFTFYFTSALSAVCVQCQIWMRFCNSLISCFPGVMLTDCLSDFEMVPVVLFLLILL